MSESTAPTTSTSKKKRLKWRYYTLLPSDFGASSLVGVLVFIVFILLFLGSLESMFLPGELFGMSLLVLLIAYWACSFIARKVAYFGIEMRPFRLFRHSVLWLLAVRIMFVPLVVALLLTPVAVLVITTNYTESIQHRWLLAVNVMLIHILFFIGSSFIYVSPVQNAFARFGILALFPYRLITGTIFSWFGWFLLIIFNAVSRIWDDGQSYLGKLIQASAAGADYLMTLSGIGPLILFWLNPYYLLLRLHSENAPSAGAFAFSGVCIIAITGMIVQLYRWENVDLKRLSAEFYDEWLLHRDEIAVEVLAQGASSTDTEDDDYTDAAGDQHSEYMQELAPQATLSPENSARGRVEQYHLPHAQVPPAVLLTEMSAIDPLMSSIKILGGLVVITCLTEFFFNGALGYALGLWALTSLFNMWEASPASKIVPQPVWPVIKWSIRTRLLPRIAVDLILTALFVLLNNIPLYFAPLIVFTILTLRLHALATSISYAYQARWTFACNLLCTIAGFFFALMVIVTAVESETRTSNGLRNGLWFFFPALLIPIAVSASALAVTIRYTFGALVHREEIRPPGQE